MIDIGIILNDYGTFKYIMSLLEKYFHCPPYHSGNEWRLPFMRVTVLMASQARGHKFDFIYYDNNITTNIVQEIIFPICQWSRPKPLEYLLDKIEENKYV